VSRSSEALDISSEMARIHAVTYEREPEPARTTLDDHVATCVLGIRLTPAEELLVANGCGRILSGQREALEHALAPALSAAVERATGRAVATFVCGTDLDAGVTVLTFVFADAAEPPAA
jgi:uncharacterized protein YbcI